MERSSRGGLLDLWKIVMGKLLEKNQSMSSKDYREYVDNIVNSRPKEKTLGRQSIKPKNKKRYTKGKYK